LDDVIGRAGCGAVFSDACAGFGGFGFLGAEVIDNCCQFFQLALGGDADDLDLIADTLQLQRQAGGALPGRVLELWLIAEGAAAPVSLGVLPEAQDAQIIMPDTIAVQIASGLLAISDEPQGGSPPVRQQVLFLLPVR